MSASWIRADDLLEAFEDYWPRRFARNIAYAAALRGEYLRGERAGWNEACDADYDDDDRDDEGCVLGDRCCCPHPFHTSSECYTAEWAEQYFAETADER